MKTLQQFNKPVFQPLVGVGDQVSKDVGDRVKLAWEVASMSDRPVPDSEALRFYLLNHTVAIIKANHLPTQPLGEAEVAVMERYVQVSMEQARRMFCYMILICTRESRHIKTCPAYGNLGNTYSDKAHKKFLSSIKGTGSHPAAEAFMNYAPDTSFTDYVEGLRKLFAEGKWGGGYGGKAWAEVTELLCRFVRGEISGELLVDQGYTLAHNNGPIFNKGMFYDNYTGKFGRLLDVQRSGQIPELIYSHLNQNDHAIHNGSVYEVEGDYDLCREVLPDTHDTYVDWWKVEALGGLGNFQSFKADQKEKYGISKWEAKQAELKAAQENVLKQKAELAEQQYQASQKAAAAMKAKQNYVLGTITFKKEQRV